MSEDLKKPTQETVNEVDVESKGEIKEEVKEVHYNCGEMFSSSIHTYTFALLAYIIVNAGFRFYAYWVYDLFALLWVDVVFYVVAICTAVCWSICWWAQIAPQLITARNPWKNNKIMFIIVIMLMPFYALLIQNEAFVGTDGRGSITCLLILFGGQIALRFLMLWLQFRNDLRYKKISFIDFCNLPIAEK